MLENFRYDEHKRNERLLNEVASVDKENLKQLFLYVLNTELLGNLEANEAAREYHDGKFDPSMLKYANPKNLKKKQQAKKANV